MLQQPELIEHTRSALQCGHADSAAKLAAQAFVKTFAAGERLFDTTQSCEGFPLVVEGQVRIVRYSAQGREIQLYRIRAGEACILSITHLLGGPVYQAVGMADTALRVVVIPARLFHDLIASDTSFRNHIFGIISTRIGELMSLVEAIAFDHLDQRLARILIEEGPQLRTTHQRLAERTGSVREFVGRVLRNFEDRGLIKIGRERITLVDVGGVAEIAAGAG